MRYLIVAEAYRDLEQASGRLALVDRLAVLLAQTPAGLLPEVCYLCQGLIAPEFAGVDLGLAEKLAVRAVAAATGAEPGPVATLLLQIGDLGQAAEQLLAVTAGERPASLTVTTVVDTLHQIAAAEGPGSQGRKLDLLAGLLGQATPLEARYLLRLVTKGLRLGIGTPTILDALAQVYAGRRAARPVLERALQHLLRPGPGGFCSRRGGVGAVEQIGVRPGTRCGRCWPSGCPTLRRSWPGSGGRCAAEYKYNGVPGRGAPHRRRGDRAVYPAAGAGQLPVPGRRRRPWRPGWGPARRSSRERSSPTTRQRVSCGRSVRSCSGGVSTASTRPSWMSQ